MRKSTKAIGLLFLAATSVYSGQVIGAGPAKSGKAADPKANQTTNVKLLDEAVDPQYVGPSTRPSNAPTTNPSAPAPSNGLMVAPDMQTNADGTFSLNITNGADLGETLRVIG